MNNYDEKIIDIKDTQKRLLELVKGKIEEENKIFNLNTRNIVDVLNHDNIVVKKYEAVVNAQKLIEKYTEDIRKSNSIEEIKEIRNSLNKEINKIKKEMKNRGFDDIELNKYSDDAKRLRKRISENIRFIKREEKINEINTLYNNFDNLNEEELLNLKRLIKNEISYGKRNINRYSLDDNNVNTTRNINLEEKKDTLEKTNITFDEENIVDNRGLTLDFKKYDSLHDYLNDRVDYYDKQYKVDKTEEYDGGVIKNLTIFAKNVPKLFNNKKRVKLMVRDYNLFCKKPELLGYSDYISYHSDILYNLKKAMKNGVLKNRENEYSDNHKKIAGWIIRYCNHNDMTIKYNKAM